MTDDQDTLIPTGALKFTEMAVKLDQLPSGFVISRQPSDAMIQSIKKFGVLVPILVTTSPSGTVQLAAGRRRVIAARKAGLKEIPARMVRVEGGWLDQQEVLAVAENHYRDENPAAEAVAVRDMVARGHSPESVKRDLGMSEREFKPIADLLSLDPAIFTGFTQGAVKVGVARRIAKLPPSTQKQLAIKMAEAGRLKHHDVNATLTPVPMGGRLDIPDAQDGLGASGAAGTDARALLAEVPLLDLLRAAAARTTSDTVRFVLTRAIKMAEEEDNGGDVAVPLGDAEADEALQSLRGELASDREDRHQLVAPSAEPA